MVEYSEENIKGAYEEALSRGEVIDFKKDEGYVTPSECVGEDPVYVSRLREDLTLENGISLWVVADNLRKGAALNTVQIAETLTSGYMD